MDELARARLAAERLLRWLRTRRADPLALSAPISVDAIAAALGLAVAYFHPRTQPLGTFGYLEPGENLIFLQAGLPDPVRRFTLAHEMGHALLHRAGAQAALPRTEVGACVSADLDAPLDAPSGDDELLHPGQAYSARSQRESEANAFAAVLLLPAEELIAVYLAAMPPDGGRANVTRDVADHFGVSEDVVLRRLTALLAPDPSDAPMGAPSERDPAPGGTADACTTTIRPLDAAQRTAARARTPALVVAGPGTGKTSTLVLRVTSLVRERHVPPAAILALTFSKKAAHEMRARVLAALQPAASSTADAMEDAIVPPLAEIPTVSTFHGFCGTLLRRYGPLVGLRPDFRLVTEAEGYFLLRQVVPGLALKYYQPLAAPAQYFPDLLAAISRAKDEAADPATYATLAEAMATRATTAAECEDAERAREVAAVYTAYQRALDERGDADFGDIIRLAVRLLRNHAKVLAATRAQYQQVLVDEFQDINRAMGLLLALLCGDDGPLWAVGDPDQAIYRFRGASPATIAHFTRAYPTGHLYPLRHNYRSAPPIITAATALARAFLGNDARTGLIAERPVGTGPAVTLAAAPDDAAELAGIVAAIRARREEGCALADQAVLCRTRRHARRVAAALEDAGLRARMLVPLLQQPDVKDLMAVAALLADGSGAGLLRAGALAAHAFSGTDAQAVLDAAHARRVAPVALLAGDGDDLPGVSPTGAHGLRRLAAALAAMRQAPDVATGLARYVFDLTPLGRGLLAGLADGDTVTRDQARHVARVLALARAFMDQRRAGALDASGDGAGAGWHTFLDYLRVLVVLRQGTADAADDLVASADDGVWVLTVHASKGLEFPFVYLPGLAARRFPIQRQHDSAPMPPGLTEEATAAPDDVYLAEETCLMYVAITRARDGLLLSVAERYGHAHYRPSPFLAPIEQALGATLNRVRWPAVATALVDGLAATQLAKPLAASDAALSVAALETYVRCPRQYAYRYVSGLRPRDASLAVMRQSVQRTVQALALHATVHSHEANLDDVRTLFASAWDDAVAQLHRARAPDRGNGSAMPAGDPWREVYRRYGEDIVVRAWSERAASTFPAAATGCGPRVEFDHDATVHVGRRAISLSVDRIEQPPIADARDAATGAGQASGPAPSNRPGGAPARYIRHRLGRLDDRPDLRTLLYHMAAQQQGQDTTEVYQVQLTTGTAAPMQLNARQAERLRTELDRALDGIEHGDDTPHPDPHTCSGCPFVLICPAQ